MWWLVLIVFAFVVPEILSTILESRIGRAIAAQIESRGWAAGSQGPENRIRDLEGEVDRLAREVGRLTEEAEFIQRLLSERSRETDPERAPRDGAS